MLQLKHPQSDRVYFKDPKLLRPPPLKTLSKHTLMKSHISKPRVTQPHHAVSIPVSLCLLFVLGKQPITGKAIVSKKE